MTIQSRTHSRTSDRENYLPAAVVVSALVVIGFAQSYFSRLFVPHAESLTLLVHVHGALMTAWLLLFCLQIALIAVGRTDLHRRLGRVGFGLLAMIVGVAIPTTIVATRLGGNHMPGPALPGLALVLALFFEFATLGGLGLWYRGRSDIHKRLMLLAAITAMEAGVSRLPLNFLDSSAKVHMANDAVLLLIVVVDTIKHRRLHPAFLWGSLFLVSVQTLSTWISSTEWWLRVARGIMAPFS